MTHRSRAEASTSTPLATVEEIQRRLLRAPFLYSPPPSSTISSPDGVRTRNFSQFNSNSTEFKKEAKEKRAAKKNLEDFLDPVLLSAISSKIGHVKKAPDMKRKKDIKDFEWPVDELKVFMPDSSTENKAKLSSDDREAVDLKDDLDVFEDAGIGGEECSTPFRRFEKIALRCFKALGEA